MRKNIVFVVNYFYPDVASTGQLLTDLCLELQHDFDITVIAVQQEERPAVKDKSKRKWFEEEALEQIRIIRVKAPRVDKGSKWSRIRFISVYFFMALASLLRAKKPDIIYTISSPPILGGLIGTIGKAVKNTKHVYTVHDFNPEQAEAISYTRQKWIFRLARYLDNINCRFSDHVITVGRDMQQTLMSRLKGRRVPANSVINNWMDEKDIVPLSKSHPAVARFLSEHGLDNKFIIMYSGNLGLYYDLENLIKVCRRFAGHPDIVFVFIGDGAVKPAMQKYAREHGLNEVVFLPFQPRSDIKFSLNAADVHLVVNQKGIKGVSVPSKIYGVLAAAKPVIGVLEEGSEASELIKTSECGIVIEPKQYNEIAESIEKLYQMDSEALVRMGENGRRYLEQHLTKQLSIAKYKGILRSV
ncbi:glycosyltransferase family 4 protein [Paenibacillus senegalensis]|uniref:glycosyltransferase family 4 protein n=1 Tax=Paenibacillus senegalensis TaxID=1465766 RepID=UPI00028911D0|nr:glycosyltransferase family 4 protein [Paenibacillus senegalensis]